MRAVAGMKRFRGDSSFGTWLCAIGLNAARDHLRRRGRWGATEDVSEVEIPVPAAPHGQRLDLERAIALLPPGCFSSIRISRNRSPLGLIAVSVVPGGTKKTLPGCTGSSTRPLPSISASTREPSRTHNR